MLRRISTRFQARPLVLCESTGSGTSLAPSSLSAVSAAMKLASPTLLVVGSTNVSALAKAAASVTGVANVVAVEDPVHEHLMPEKVSATTHQIMKNGNFTHLIAATTSLGRGVVPRVAAQFSCMPIPEVTAIVAEDVFTRVAYGGNVLATVQTRDTLKFLTVRPTAFERAAATGGSSEVQTEQAEPSTVKADWLEDISSKGKRVDLSSAEIVIAGGRGLKSKENFQMLFELADKMKGAVGATRAVVDEGLVPNDIQIGQTGKVVAPSLYLAVGLSGAVQHTAGMKDSKTIVAINTDAEAPIFQIATYGLVADLFEVIPEIGKRV